MSDFRMPTINEVRLAGRLTRDPELRYLQSGTAVCEFGIAVEEVYYDAQNQKQKKVYFGECVLWKEQAEKFAERVKKGRAVYVEGNLTLDEWNDKNSGEKRSKTRINVRRVQALEWDGEGQAGNGHSQSQARAPQQQQRRPGPPPPPRQAAPAYDDEPTF